MFCSPPISPQNIMQDKYSPAEVEQAAQAYWKSIDAGIGARIEEKVRSGAAPQPAEGMGEG